jgi:hypothetical protein
MYIFQINSLIQFLASYTRFERHVLIRKNICTSNFMVCTGVVWYGTGLEETIIKETEQNQLTWYGHVQRMAEGRLPK